MRRLLLTTLLLLIVPQCLMQASGQDFIASEKDLQEVTVKPKRERYRRKGNPAVELMRRVIEAKGDNDLHNNDYASYHKYQRMTFAVNNISQRHLDSLKLLQHPLAKRQIEFCPQTGKFILPFAYNEKVTLHLFRRNPKLERNYVLATNDEGLTELMPQGDVVNTVARSIFTDVNVYDDVITLFERKFTSPLSRRAAISFFQFFIQDTTVVDGDSIICVNFVPQNPQDFGFSGRIYIYHDNTYRVQQCTLNLPLRSSVNYVNNLVLTQRFADMPNGQRVLVTDDLFAEIGILKKHRTFMLHRVTNYTAISTDSIPDESFRPTDHPREGSTNVESDAFWMAHRADTLSSGEANLRSTTAFMRIRIERNALIYLLRTIISNYANTKLPAEKSYFDIGPVTTLISKNFIDGWRFRLGGQTTANVSPHLFFKGFAAYGTKSRRWYGMAELEYSFLRKQYLPLEYPRHSITLSFQDDVMSPADLMWQNGRDKDNVFVSFKWQTVDHMMFTRRWTARYEIETNNHLDFKLQWRNATLTPTGSLFYRRTDNGQLVSHLNTAEITASLRWAPGEEVINSRQRRHVVNHNNPVFSVAHTTGIKGICGNHYNYNLTEFNAYERLWLYSYGKLDINVRAGIQWNRVPFPMLIAPVANQSYIITRDMFSMIGNLEFLNDRYASIDLQWDLSGKLFNRIPLLKKLKLREVIGFKAMYGHLSQKNRPLYDRYDPHTYVPTTGEDDTPLFFFPERDGQPIVHQMTNVPYMELNVGIHNIFKILRIDYVRRLNYNNYPGVSKNGVRACLVFDF